MSLINPCNLSLNASNTGIECQAAMSVTAMNIMVPRSARWTQADIDASPYNGSFTAYAEAQTHLPPAQRWYPLNGFAAAINSITENNESDVVETFDDGSSLFVRYGKYNRTFITTGGGLCFASHLMKFPQGFSFIEVDTEGKVLVYEPTTGVFAGVPLIMFKGLAPIQSTFTTVYKNRYMMVFDPVAYIQQGKIFASSSDENILGITGLLDVTVTVGETTQTTTNIFVGAETECAQTDLVELYGEDLAQPENFIVTNQATGAVISITAAAVEAGEVKLTGTFVSGQSYLVGLAAPTILVGNDISGYEGTVKAVVTIP